MPVNETISIMTHFSSSFQHGFKQSSTIIWIAWETLKQIPLVRCRQMCIYRVAPKK